jgi:hypothetical protein
MTRLVSEDIEPTFARVIGVMFKRCEEAQGEHALYAACNRFWWAANGINKITIAVRDGHHDADCVHASLAAGNELRRIADYIRHRIGIDPLTEKHPDWDI